MGKKESPLVSIKCLVYNHGPYLRQCLDGFVMQKTNFAFEAIVHDDASTDNSAEIIREYAEKYPDIIKPIYETENQYSKKDGSLNRIMNAAIHPDAKYIAFCEGDDYWIDPLKLQKQVDFLEKNLEYGMTFGKVKQFIQQTGLFSKHKFGKEISSVLNLFHANTVPTPTVMYRRYLFDSYKNEINSSNWMLGDYPLWLYISINTKTNFMNQVFAVYRVLPNSASHSTNIKKREDFIYSVFEMKQYFNQKYKFVNESLLENYKNEALLTNAYNFKVYEKVVEYYKKISIGCSWKTHIKYFISKFRLLYKK